MIDFDSRNFITADVIKYIFMIQDMMSVKSPNVNGEMCIFDAKGLTVWHVMKLASNVSAIRHFMKYVQEAAPIRLIQNHYVNCTPALSKVMALLKPFMKKEMSENMHFHTNGFESLHKFVPANCLPEEYEGTQGKLEDYFNTTVANIKDLRDYLIKDENFFLSED